MATAYEAMFDGARARQLDVELLTVTAVYGPDGMLQTPGRMDKIRIRSGSSIVANADIPDGAGGLELAARKVIDRLKLIA